MKISAALISALAVSALAAPAMATEIDFTSSEFGTDFSNEVQWGDSEYSFDADGVTVTLSAEPSGASLTQSNEGIGVSSSAPGGGSFLINDNESLLISFDSGVSDVELGFYGAQTWNGDFQGVVTSSDGTVSTFELPFFSETDLSLSGSDITSIELTAASGSPDWIGLQLAGLSFSASGGTTTVSVPELSAQSGMSAFALLGGAFLVLNGRRRVNVKGA